MAMSNAYQEFLYRKMQRPVYQGFDYDVNNLNTNMYPFQRDIVLWALKLGKAAVFSQVGTGKTIMQLSWAKAVNEYTNKPVLILAPLAVSGQTIREGAKFGIDVVYRKDETEIEASDKIVVTNYERVDKFVHFVAMISGIVLDESSILKNYTGKTKQAIINTFRDTPYKLACSATPAPNDHLELGNHADFLDIMPSSEMIMRWFVNDTMEAGNYRLKKHAEKDFWRWLTSWAVCITKPSDLGDEYDMPEFELPALNIIGHYVAANQQAIQEAWANGRLLPDTAPSSTKLGKVKRQSLEDRLKLCQDLVASIPDNEPILIWCNLNDEADALAKAFPEAVEVRGSDSSDVKTKKLLGFSDGQHRMLITKASIAGFGMNWQHCNQAIFFGLDFSFESFYQAKGRNHRYGQTRDVNCHIIFAETEGNVISTLYRKQQLFEEMQQNMAKAMKKHGLFRDEKKLELTKPETDEASGKNWRLLLGDCVERIQDLPDNSVDFAIDSPPFSNLYTYSDSEADMGNSENDDEFFEHYKFLIAHAYRVMRPGRLYAVHCKDLPAYMNRDGAAGLRDFAGDIIRAFTEFDKPNAEEYEIAGKTLTEYLRDLEIWKAQAPKWQYHSRVTIWKDPVIEMQRTKNHGLLHKNFVKEANACRQGMADYLIVFRKWGLEGQVPVTQNRQIGDYIGTEPPTSADINVVYGNRTPEMNNSIVTWQKYASPVWADIDQTNVLNYKLAKENDDQKHICPLQLDVIARAIDLWTNKGDLVMSSFAGVGSEGHEALRLGRKFVGFELKRTYFNHAIKHLEQAEKLTGQRTLFDLLDEQEALTEPSTD